MRTARGAVVSAVQIGLALVAGLGLLVVLQALRGALGTTFTATRVRLVPGMV